MKNLHFFTACGTAIVIALSMNFRAVAQGSVVERNFTQCAAVRMDEVNIKHVEQNKAKKFTQVPEGWTVVSGSGGEGHPKLLICQ